MDQLRTIVYHLAEPGEDGKSIIEEMIIKHKADKGYTDEPVRAGDVKKIRDRMIDKYLRKGDTLIVRSICNLVLTRPELLQVKRNLDAKDIKLIIEDYPDTEHIYNAIQFMDYFNKSVKKRASGYARKSNRRNRAGRPKVLRGERLAQALEAYQEYIKNNLDVRDIMKKYGYKSTGTFYRDMRKIEDRNNQ